MSGKKKRRPIQGAETTGRASSAGTFGPGGKSTGKKSKTKSKKK